MLTGSNAPSDSIMNIPNNSEIQNDSIARDNAGNYSLCNNKSSSN